MLEKGSLRRLTLGRGVVWKVQLGSRSGLEGWDWIQDWFGRLRLGPGVVWKFEFGSRGGLELLGDPHGARMAQDASRVTSGASFLEVLGPILAPRWAKIVPRWAKFELSWRQDGPTWD